MLYLVTPEQGIGVIFGDTSTQGIGVIFGDTLA